MDLELQEVTFFHFLSYNVRTLRFRGFANTDAHMRPPPLLGIDIPQSYSKFKSNLHHVIDIQMDAVLVMSSINIRLEDLGGYSTRRV